MEKRKKGFTLIELIAVLVIMAIIALIVTPLVMSIIRKAKISAAKRSIDAYGRSIELAIAGYLLDTGTFPTSIGELTIEYSGSEVVCETTQLNSDSSIYLTGCRVGGKSVDYAYGKDKTPTYTPYSVGDQVTYNNVAYRVIKKSGVKESTLILLKVEPLSVSEVNLYGGVGTINNHVNMYATNYTSASYYQKAFNQYGYGGMTYYSSATCGFINDNWEAGGCTTSYESSDIKYVVDAWKQAKAPAATEARLITFDEVTSLGYEWQQTCDTCGMGWLKTDNVPTWLYNNSYWYWTMSPYSGISLNVKIVNIDGNISSSHIISSYGVVRPVIVLPKSVL